MLNVQIERVFLSQTPLVDAFKLDKPNSSLICLVATPWVLVISRMQENETVISPINKHILTHLHLPKSFGRFLESRGERTVYGASPEIGGFEEATGRVC